MPCHRILKTLASTTSVLVALSSTPLSAIEGATPVISHVPVSVLTLENGFRLLLVERPEATMVAAGWMVRAGSADDQPGLSGLSHLLEHMLFKGSRTVGSRDIEREMAVLALQDRLRRQIATAGDSRAKALGKKSRKQSAQLEKLHQELAVLEQQATKLALLGQFSLLYSELGAVGLNAHTLEDLTLYYVTLPGEKLEAWFWLESDRLLEPVFRELYKEIQVVHEERRLRIESTPTGTLDEALRASVWGQHPYGHNPLGAEEDLDRVDRQTAQEFFAAHYRPDNLSAALVGRFDRQQVEEWARRYFGRLPGTAARTKTMHAPTPAVRSEEFRFEGICDCPPQTRLSYPSVPFDHPDSHALQILAAVLNGRSGRLHRSLVLEQQIAFTAFAHQRGRKLAGEFSIHAESKGVATPEDLLTAWDRELARLRTDRVADAELERARNRLTAEAFRSLREPADLMRQLLVYEGLGSWQHINEWPHKIMSVSSTDLVGVIDRYLLPTRRTVAFYRRAATGSDSTTLAAAAAPRAQP